MGFRFRFGPFTVGGTGTRSSTWRGPFSVSIPLFPKNRYFGASAFGSLSSHPGYSQNAPAKSEDARKVKLSVVASYEDEAIYALRRDRVFIDILKQYGLPWRYVQERLKEELPGYLFDRDNVAFDMVPHAMNAIFGQQGVAWSTEKHPSKSRRSVTTWIVVNGGVD